MCFKAKRAAPLRKLMKVYCDRHGAVVVGGIALSRSPLCLRPGYRVPTTSQAGIKLARCAQGSKWSR